MKNILYLLTATAAWGLNFFLAKIMMESSPALIAGFWRYVVAVFILLLLLWGNLPNWKQVMAQSKRLLLVGIIGIFGFNYLFFTGLEQTSAMNAALIMSMNPALTLVLNRLILKVPITRLHVLGVSIALVGAICLMTRGDFMAIGQVTIGKGDGLMWLANLTFAFYHIWVKQYSGGMQNIHFTFFTTLICCVCFLIAVQPYALFAWLAYPPVYWYSAIGMGGTGTALAYFAWNRGVAGLGVERAAIFMNTVPLFTSFFALLFGANLAFYHLWSGLIIISGLVLMQLQHWKAKKLVLKG